MDWMIFDYEDEDNSGDQGYSPLMTPEEYIEDYEYYQQFDPKWDDTLLWITLLPE